MSMIGNLLRVKKSELDEYLQDSSLLEERIYQDDGEEPNLIDIDKAWEGIIFLLTGSNLAEAEDPLVAILFSGQLLDEEQDLGYGPAHYLTPQQVVELNDELAKFSVEDSKEKFNTEKMMELGVYPEIWDEGDQAFDYLSEHFLILQQFFNTAAANNEAVITYLS